SLTYTPVWPEKNGIRGIIALDQQYGEIMETIVAECIEKCACRTVFCGGAGGYIPGEEDVHRPPIGSRIAVRRCMHPDGETVYLDHDLNQSSSLESAMHLHVPSIFCETFDWLEDARDQGSSVDIELFHILKAISSHNERHAEDPVAGDLGYFVSDYVGEKPLREYSGVFDNYAQAIRSFLNTILGK
ncbi:MAG: hypothetical protein KDK78_04745, partial [Chlamydiia bacterium]|nr:hypothetical protein [Chlamydiia bacterium]